MDALVYFAVAVLVSLWWCRHLESTADETNEEARTKDRFNVRRFVIRF